jgi:3-oxoacyl-[acyl-carrier-protein] synthase III
MKSASPADSFKTYSKILGSGHVLPEKILHNTDIEKMVNTSDEWIRSRTGICQRHIASSSDSSSSLGKVAAEKALLAANIHPDNVGLIIVATSTSDLIFPSTACLIQAALGIKNCPAFDINAACSGFNYALSIADQFIRSGMVKTALVIGTEVMSRIVDWSDRTTCVLFADGAGAILLGASTEPGIISTHLHADGRYKDLLYTPGPLSNHLNSEPFFLKMQGKEVFKLALQASEKIIKETLEFNNLDITDIDWVIPHQANLRIMEAICKKLAIPKEKLIVTIETQGNTSAASIPMALDFSIQDGRIQRGQFLLLIGFGGGFTWGSALIQY